MTQITPRLDGFTSLDITGITQEQALALHTLLYQANSTPDRYVGLWPIAEQLRKVLETHCPSSIGSYGTSNVFELRVNAQYNSWSLHKKEPV